MFLFVVKWYHMPRSPDPMLNFSRGTNQQKPKQDPSSEVSEIIDLEIFSNYYSSNTKGNSLPAFWYLEFLQPWLMIIKLRARKEVWLS